MEQPEQEPEKWLREAKEEEEEEVPALQRRLNPGQKIDFDNSSVKQPGGAETGGGREQKMDFDSGNNEEHNGAGEGEGGKLEGIESTKRNQQGKNRESSASIYGVDEEEVIEEIEEELDVEWVLRKQNTYDLSCPICQSCITRTVILRRREPKPENKFDGTTDDDENKPGKREEGIECLSCFSFFIPTGNGFCILKGSTGSKATKSKPIPEEKTHSDRTECWLFHIFDSIKKKTPPEEEEDIERRQVKQTGDSHGSASTTDATEPRASESRRLEILKSIVYGGLIESITSLGVVSSAAGGGASTLNILALGLANLISGLLILVHNLRELKKDQPEGETNTQQDQYQELLGRRENFGWHVTLSILSYLIFGLVPPIVYAFSFRQSNDADLKLAAVAAASLVCIILLAIGKAHIGKPPRTYFKTVSYYVIAGFAASGVSFLVGELVRKLLEKLGWFESSSALTMPILEAKRSERAWGSF